ncbi:hypothetical protein QJQ45_019907 [Haematococcus lacustris]|nr:hypothetical protein QJQ45_019907 [Haematococcus lacustris]
MAFRTVFDTAFGAVTNQAGSDSKEKETAPSMDCCPSLLQILNAENALPSYEADYSRTKPSKHSLLSQQTADLEQLFSRLSQGSTTTLAGPSPTSSLAGPWDGILSSSGLSRPSATDAWQPSPSLSLPCSITVTSSTDPMQAAGLINFSLSQPGTTSFVLQAAAGSPGSTGSQAAFNAALKVAVAARKLHLATAAPDTDMGILPLYPGADATALGPSPLDSLHLHVYCVGVQARLAQAKGLPMRVDPQGSVLVLSLQLTQLISSAGQTGGVVDLTFGPAAAQLALQTLAMARANLLGSGQDAVLLVQQLVEGLGSVPAFLIRAVPTCLLSQEGGTAQSMPHAYPTPHCGSDGLPSNLPRWPSHEALSLQQLGWEGWAGSGCAPGGGSPPGTAAAGGSFESSHSMGHSSSMSRNSYSPQLPVQQQQQQQQFLGGGRTSLQFHHNHNHPNHLRPSNRSNRHSPDDDSQQRYGEGRRWQAAAEGQGWGQGQGLGQGQGQNLHHSNNGERPGIPGLPTGAQPAQGSAWSDLQMLVNDMPGAPPSPISPGFPLGLHQDMGQLLASISSQGAASSPFDSMHDMGMQAPATSMAMLGQQAGTMAAAAAMLARATAAAAVAAAATTATTSAGPSRSRSRKADWVIVTEDTAIKNAAGAVAKVLSRVGPQGLCCPVFTEKKTDKYTRVVSVAVKAIAVARGYVCNEGTGHEVGFQPYLRHDPSSAWSGSSRPPGAPPCGGQWPGEIGDVTQLSGPGSHSGFPPSLTRQTSGLSCRGVPGGDSPVPGLPPSVYGCSPSAASSVSGAGVRGLSPRGSSPPGASPRGSSPRGSSPMPRGGSPVQWGGAAAGGLGGSRPQGLALGGSRMEEGEGGQVAGMVVGGSSGSSSCTEEEGGGHLAEAERSEMAFDVFKVTMAAEACDNGNLPVKVTAHSRPSVVSNIITKLVTERGSAVLITAGGRAMHVAMAAVVSSRTRLRTRGLDIILLPRFVTVDTTSTLGWESVFLRFNIVKWAPAASLAAEELAHQLFLHRVSS